MSDMFCFQCEQTAGGKGCTKAGACGKSPEVSNLQDEITAALITLARAVDGQPVDPKVEALFMDALFMCITNVNFDPKDNAAMRDRILQAAVAAGGANTYRPEDLFHGDADVVSLRSTLLFGLRGMAAYAAHARVLGKTDPKVSAWFQKGMKALGDDHSVEEWLGLIMEFGQINLACMELLDAANTGAYGHPEPTRVSVTRHQGPFIIVTGHDLLDLKMLLEQSEGKGVNIYTHGEMLPALAYPGLKKYTHLKGHFGTAWQNQQKEFADLPGVVLFTTNCIMPPRPSYIRHLATTAEVGWPGVRHIAADETGHKDFSSIIQQAIDLGGWTEETPGAYELMTGFAHNAVMSVADKLVDAVKSGALKHIYLVGGCDGAKLGRDYYTQFVEKTPKDTLVPDAGLRQVPLQPPAGQAGRHRRDPAPARHGPVQRRLLRHPSRRDLGEGLQLRRQRPAPLAGALLVRAESRLHPADAPLPRHQEHPHRAHAPRVRLAHGPHRPRGEIRAHPHLHPRRRPQGPRRLSGIHPPNETAAPSRRGRFFAPDALS
jgi:hydroxylamine reductase